MHRFASIALLVSTSLLLACSGHDDAPSPTCGDGAVAAPEACDEGPVNGEPGHCKADCSGVPAQVSVSGDLFAFAGEVTGARISGATISVLERPEKTATTDAAAHFEIDGLDEGSDVTLVVDHPDLFPTQTGTITLGPHGVHPFTIQALPKKLYNALAGFLPTIDFDHNCAMATTVSRLGGTLHVMVRQGEAGAVVSVSPALPAEVGPIYFNELVVPDGTLAATTKDGGVVFANAPPGEYTLTASKDGTAFAPVRMKCRAGWLVNAGPPVGLQANASAPDWGGDVGQGAVPAAMDALCEQTAACVNEKTPDRYPPTTVESCKATFRRALSFVDAGCDATAHLVDAWSAYYACKAASCDATLGNDSFCATEEQAWIDAMAAYAPCYSASHAR